VKILTSPLLWVTACLETFDCPKMFAVFIRLPARNPGWHLKAVVPLNRKPRTPGRSPNDCNRPANPCVLQAQSFDIYSKRDTVTKKKKWVSFRRFYTKGSSRFHSTFPLVTYFLNQRLTIVRLSSYGGRGLRKISFWKGLPTPESVTS
jgi:hypothetical protein